MKLIYICHMTQPQKVSTNSFIVLNLQPNQAYTYQVKTLTRAGFKPYLNMEHVGGCAAWAGILMFMHANQICGSTWQFVISLVYLLKAIVGDIFILHHLYIFEEIKSHLCSNFYSIQTYHYSNHVDQHLSMQFNDLMSTNLLQSGFKSNLFAYARVVKHAWV